jgi:K+-transporting ATPase KdpF subunit
MGGWPEATLIRISSLTTYAGLVLHCHHSWLFRSHAHFHLGVRESLTSAHHPTMINLVVAIIALALIAYLIFTIIRPEKF